MPVEANLLKPPLRIFQCIGLWRPTNWQSTWKARLYDFYTCIMVLYVLTSTISEFIELLRTMDDVKAFANKAFVFLTVIGVCGKATNVLVKRSSLVDLIDLLKSDPCRARNPEETIIQERFDRLTRLNTLRYAALTGAGVTAIVVGSLLQAPRKIVPYNGWVPYDSTTWVGYWIAYFHQMGAHIVGACVNVGFDTLVPGLMIQTCAQLSILKNRFYHLPKAVTNPTRLVMKENGNVTDNLESTMLAKFAEKSNSTFSLMIFLQYSLSSVVLCFSVFELSRMKPFSPEFTSTLMYLACMSMQIYIFCFYGCQVTVESLKLRDGIYDMDWTTLSVSAKHSLLTIMVRTAKPIEFKSGHLITLNLESFNSLIKLSYSAYNVLQQTSDK